MKNNHDEMWRAVIKKHEEELQYFKNLSKIINKGDSLNDEQRHEARRLIMYSHEKNFLSKEKLSERDYSYTVVIKHLEDIGYYSLPEIRKQNKTYNIKDFIKHYLYPCLAIGFTLGVVVGFIMFSLILTEECKPTNPIENTK